MDEKKIKQLCVSVEASLNEHNLTVEEAELVFMNCLFSLYFINKILPEKFTANLIENGYKKFYEINLNFIEKEIIPEETPVVESPIEEEKPVSKKPISKKRKK